MPPPDFYSVNLQRCPILSAFLRNCQVVLVLLVWGPRWENQLPQISHDAAKCSRIKWRNMPAASEGYAASKTAVPGEEKPKDQIITEPASVSARAFPGVLPVFWGESRDYETWQSIWLSLKSPLKAHELGNWWVGLKFIGLNLALQESWIWHNQLLISQ